MCMQGTSTPETETSESVTINLAIQFSQEAAIPAGERWEGIVGRRFTTPHQAFIIEMEQDFTLVPCGQITNPFTVIPKPWDAPLPPDQGNLPVIIPPGLCVGGG